MSVGKLDLCSQPCHLRSYIRGIQRSGIPRCNAILKKLGCFGFVFFGAMLQHVCHRAHDAEFRWIDIPPNT